jgi:antitoxin HigA-1
MWYESRPAHQILVVTKAMSKMFNPPHPAAILREDVLPALGLTVTEAAEQLGVSRVTLSRLLNERGGITPEMALRIEQWLGVERGGRADLWLGMQLDYDLWHARKHAPKKIKRAPAVAAA